MEQRVRHTRDWLFLCMYLSCIFIFLPFSEYVTRAVLNGWPQFSFAVMFSTCLYVCLIGIILAAYTVIVDKRFKLLRLLALTVIISAGLYSLAKIGNPRDKLHIIEYSLLTFLLFRVLRFYNFTSALYMWCIIFIGVAGFADESVQAFIPGRVSGIKDWMMDIGTGIFSLLLVAIVICPKLEEWRVRLDAAVSNESKKQRWAYEYKRKRDKHRAR